MVDYLSFEGGGLKAYAYVGVLKCLEDKKVDISKLKVISGSSIGAFTALCIVLGYNSAEFESILRSISIPDFLNCGSIMKALPNLFWYYGMISLSALEKLIKNAIETKGLSADITFAEFFEKNKTDFIVTGSNINTMRTHYYNHKNTPTMKIADAVKISVSYPILFIPTMNTEDNNYYVDGGLFRNLPFQYGETEYHDLKSIGFVLKEESEKYQESRNIIEYLLCLLNGLYNNSTWSDFCNDKYEKDPRICEIPVPKEVSSFSVTEVQKEELKTNGYQATESFLQKKKEEEAHYIV
jgi:NTE family protein